jgi:chemotaxis protein methyltransferase CheR
MFDLNLTEVRKYILSKLGLKFNKNQEKELYSKLSSASLSFKFDKTEHFINWILNQDLSMEQTEKLASFLTIGETYFFREKKALEFLEFEFFPDLIKKRRGINQRLNIWSAGCATGEEPYSIAILLQRIIPDIEYWNVKILASDINPVFIKKAREGVYSDWSFRGNSNDFRTNYFSEVQKGKFEINAKIKNMVSFSFINLAANSCLTFNNNSTFDIILCRNVLIYFSNEGIKSVSSHLYDSLNNNGILVLSPVEVSDLISPKFERLSYKGFTIFKKDTVKYDESKNKVDSVISPINYKLLTNTTLNQKLNKSKYEQKSPKAIAPTQETPSKKQVKAPIIKDPQKLFDAGQLDEAEQLIYGLNKSNTLDNDAHLLLLARIRANKGELIESEIFCNQAISINKINEQAHYLLATILSEQGKYSEAKNALKKTIFLNPDFALAHFLLANISLNGPNKTESKKHFSNAMKSLEKLDPNDLLAESEGITAGRLAEIINSIR